jgi:CRP/FNR family cyclic AMP-dependent transcriptional regulator
MEQRDAVSAVLAASWFGSGLSLHTRSRLAECASIQDIASGTILMREGDETSMLAIVVRGRIALQMHVPERGTATILTVEPGDIVGWSAIVPPHRSTSTAAALEDSTLLVFESRELRTLLDADVALAATLYPRLLEALGRRLSATRNQLLDLYRQERPVVPW